MADSVVKVTSDMLSAMAETQQAAEDLAHIKFDIGNMAVFSAIDVDFKQSK